MGMGKGGVARSFVGGVYLKRMVVLVLTDWREGFLESRTLRAKVRAVRKEEKSFKEKQRQNGRAWRGTPETHSNMKAFLSYYLASVTC